MILRGEGSTAGPGVAITGMKITARLQTLSLAGLAFAGLSLVLPGSAKAWSSSSTDVTFTNSGGLKVPGKLFKPVGSGPFPAVVMLHGCNGIYSNSDPSQGVANTYREWADRLVAAGYVALLVDSFTPRGTKNECGNGAIGVSEVTDRPLDVQAAYTYLAGLASVNAQKVGLLGWSHGGSTVLAALETSNVLGHPFRTAVAFYPGCGLYNAYGGIAASTWAPYAPLTILHGGVDPLYTDGRCNTRVTRAVAKGAPAALVMYSGAKHGFDMAGVSTGTYSQADYNAKAQADAAAMTQFNAALK